MTHDHIFKRFLNRFKKYKEDDISMWFPNGKNSIRVRMNDGQEFIFSYDEISHEWNVETRECFIAKLKGEIGMPCLTS